MKRILILFLMLFALSTITATAGTLIKENIVKNIFTLKKEIASFKVIQEKLELSVPFIPDRQKLQFINYSKKSIIYSAYHFSNKAAAVPDKDVVWLTNMKSK